MDLRGAKLTDAKLIAAILAGAFLYGAVFTNAHLDSAILAARFTGGHLAGGERLVGPDFTSAYLAGATWPEETPPKGWNRDPSTGQLWSDNADANDSGN